VTLTQRLKREAARVVRQIWTLPAKTRSQPPAMDPESMRRLAANNVTLAAELERARDIITHLRRVEVGYLEARDALDQCQAALELANHELQDARETSQRQDAELQTAHRGAQALVNFFQRLLFERQQTTDPSRWAATLVLADRPVEESLETLVNRSEEAHGARPFQYILPFLAAPQPFPAPWPTHMPPLRIVDIGSQMLATEEDIHAPLRRAAPTEIIGFDPFAIGKAGEPVSISRPDGSVIYTYPNVVGDGEPVTLHINRYDPTSSIFPSNLKLAGQFGLLAAALETVKTREFLSARLDDILPDIAVDFLKIDVQGAAGLVLLNAPRILAKTLVCHVEVEFVPVYEGEPLFADVDIVLRRAGFCFVDFYNLGRQRYVRFEDSPQRAFHRGRTLWGDCIYIRGLDDPDALTDDELFRAAFVVHTCYNKQDLAAELLGRIDDRAQRSGRFDSPAPAAW
jgi:hypothetical protein